MHRFQLAGRLIAVALVAIVAIAVAPSSRGGEEPTVSLRWALGALDTEGDSPAAIKRDTQLKSGTRLKFLVEPISSGAAYLILLDSSDQIHVLYRETAEPAQDAAEPTYIPSGRHWFELEEPAGMETFFLLASVEPLTELEALLDRHESADAAGKKQVVPGIVQEIRRLHKEHRQFARPVEKPVVIGGVTRGGEDSASAIDRLAMEITAERFYGKTITIDH